VENNSRIDDGSSADTAVERIIREFQKQRQPLLSYLRAMTCNSDAAEDLIQELSVIVLRKANAGERPADLLAWCRGIARNLMLRERRDNRRMVYFGDENWIALVDRAFDENPTESGEFRRGSLRHCIDKLGAQARELLDLRYTHALKLKEIATRLKRTELAVQVSLSRLRKSLRLCIERKTSGVENTG
jgi:RNA polymerase sigma-70 factor (ECF subfamily)